MFSTTLRIEDELGRFLTELAQSRALSVNAFLADLIERERRLLHRQRLAQDWAAYAQEDPGAEYALTAQGELAAERRAGYQAGSRKTSKPASTRRKA